MSDQPTTRPTVVTAVVTSERGVLLLERRDGAPAWTFPGGEQETGEDYFDTAVRECAEETGLEVTPVWHLGERIHPKSQRHMVYLACSTMDLDVTNLEPDEHVQVRWVPYAEAAGLLPGLFTPVAEHLEHVFQVDVDRCSACGRVPGKWQPTVGGKRDRLTIEECRQCGAAWTGLH